jgi:DNA-binding response OmpR family regulator
MTRFVLLCDDEIYILRAAEFKFRRAGFDVQIAADGEEAWEAIRARRPDLLITDCEMPRLDGLGLIQRVRQDPALADLPVLMLTGKGFELDSRELATRWNVLAVIPKPFSPRALVAQAETILAGLCVSHAGGEKSGELAQ